MSETVQDHLLADRLIRLHPLTYVDEGVESMVGRPDTGTYGIFPTAGVAVLRRLEAGCRLGTAAQEWREATGTELDLNDFLSTLWALDFVVPRGAEPAAPPPVRWQRLGRAVFSAPALALYAALVVTGIALMIKDPSLRPSYRQLFFTEHLTLIPILLAVGQFPLLLLHEGFHALAARRLGLPSTLGVGRRFYYLVAETRMDALYSVPRRQRYLPFLAGAMIDAAGVGALTLAAAIGRSHGAPPILTGLALAFALTGVLRIVWECLFYLETDFYFVINTATRCDDLHAAARQLLITTVRRWTGRSAPAGEPVGSDRDRRMARWYAPLMVLGYGVSTSTLLLVALPTAWTFWTTAVHRLDGSTPRTTGAVVDTVFFLLLTLSQLGLLAYVFVRDLRRRSASPERNPS